MRFLLSLAAIAAAVAASPLASQAQLLKEINMKTVQSEGCQLTAPPNNCANAEMKDIIFELPKEAGTEQTDLIFNAITASGGQILHDWKTLGMFSAFVPNQVLSLIQAHGNTIGLKTWENACTEIPWCGEAPC
ncbi:hypothetical protein CC78DRAFT_583840 [Lojkania enalia]|uniref:Uncharacterized protein n=1 Tax=Lojkania enalia TaxID=147567 RepID=A0A9P4K732_9PLEO|nr:hypothetical protein CC78DRAFT_583840 [Didymosphaeria enalia]